MLKKRIYLYKLTDALGNINISVLDDPSDCGFIWGYDINGVPSCFQEQPLHFAYDWANRNNFKLESGEMEIEIPNEIFK